MSSIRNTKNRIKSVQTTAKITKAMKAIAAMRLKRYSSKATHVEQYTKTLQNSLNDVLQTVPATNSVLAGNPAGKILLVIVGPSRGFCGGLHRTAVSETIKYFQAQSVDITDQSQVEIITINRPANRVVSKTGGKVLASFDGPYKQIDTYKILPISELINQLWLTGTYKAVYLSSAKANSALKANIIVDQFLPFGESLGQKDNDGNVGVSVTNKTPVNIDTDSDHLVAEIIPQLIHAEIYLGLLLTQTAEEGARMLAMNQATDNAKELEKKLQIVYFRQRQAKITQEIAEIVGGSL
jgi:F-type H+-transporting ATPase subunit gamma